MLVLSSSADTPLRLPACTHDTAHRHAHTLMTAGDCCHGDALGATGASLGCWYPHLCVCVCVSVSVCECVLRPYRTARTTQISSKSRFLRRASKSVSGTGAGLSLTYACDIVKLFLKCCSRGAFCHLSCWDGCEGWEGGGDEGEGSRVSAGVCARTERSGRAQRVLTRRGA